VSARILGAKKKNEAKERSILKRTGVDVHHESPRKWGKIEGVKVGHGRAQEALRILLGSPLRGKRGKKEIRRKSDVRGR